MIIFYGHHCWFINCDVAVLNYSITARYTKNETKSTVIKNIVDIY